MKHGDLVEIVWDDARSLNGWIEPEALEAWRHDHATRRMHSVGYVYEDNDKTICIIGSSSQGDPIVYADALEIPKPMIKQMRRLRRGRGGGV